MALITVAEAKAILGIASAVTTYDTQLGILIPLVSYQVMYSICQNRFVNQQITMRSSTLTFANSGATIVDSESQFVINDFPTGTGDIVVGGSFSNDGLYEVTSISAGTITLNVSLMTKALVDEAEGEFIEIKYVQFPQELKLTTARWLWYLINSKGISSGISSETTLSYSVSFINDVPKDIMKEFNAYKKLKFS